MHKELYVGLGDIENFLPRLLWSLLSQLLQYHGIEMNYSKYTQNCLHSIFAWMNFVYQLRATSYHNRKEFGKTSLTYRAWNIYKF